MKLFDEKNLLKEIYEKFKRVEGPKYKKYFIEIGKKSIEILRKDDTICRIILDEYGADKIEFFDFKKTVLQKRNVFPDSVRPLRHKSEAVDFKRLTVQQKQQGGNRLNVALEF